MPWPLELAVTGMLLEDEGWKGTAPGRRLESKGRGPNRTKKGLSALAVVQVSEQG